MSPTQPPDAARWTGEQQEWQDYKWSSDQREKKCSEKPHSAIHAEKSCQNTKDKIDGRFEHQGRSRRWTSRSPSGKQLTPTPDHILKTINCPLPCWSLQNQLERTWYFGCANPTSLAVL